MHTNQEKKLQMLGKESLFHIVSPVDFYEIE
jgi:hypothetical protein